MKAHHILIVVVILAAGYAAGRFFPTWGTMVGLP